MHALNHNGDQRTHLFEEWYENDMPRLYGYIFYRVQDKQLAEDLTTAACEKALDNLKQYDPTRGDIKDWLFGIARNETRRHFRRTRHRPAELSLDDLPDLSIELRPVEQELQMRETLREVLAAMQNLRDRPREVVALRYGAGLSNAEIAHLLGLSENHVAVTLHRALKTLRDALSSKVEAGNDTHQ